MFLERRDARIHYRLDGAEEAPLMMFANSLGSNLHVWDELLPYLPGYRFLRYDKRGHGQSNFTGEFGMQDLVDDAIALIEEVGARDAIFIGLSIGGLIGQGIAAEHPNFLKAFILMDSAAKIGTKESWNERIVDIRKNGLTGIATSMMSRWFTQDFIAAGHSEPWRDMIASCDPEGYICCCNAIAHTDLVASTSRLKLPMLAIAGAEDGSTPPDLVRKTVDLVDGAQFKLIREAGHIPCVEQPKATASAILDFLGDVS